jgi:hypothetical protein
MQLMNKHKSFVLIDLNTPLMVGGRARRDAIGYTHAEENMRLLLASLLLLTAVAAAQSVRRAVVLEPVLNMYSRASLDADVVSQARYAMTVELVAQEGEWWRIKTPDDYPGWVEARALRALGEEEPYAAKGRTATVESLVAHLYRENSVTRHRPLLSVPFETVLR